MWKKINFERTAAICFVLLCAGFGLFLGARYLLPALLPFAFAWGVAFSLRPLSCALHRRLRLPKKMASVFLVLLFLGLFFFLVYLLLYRMTAELKALLLRLKEEPQILENFITKINDFFKNLRSFIPVLPTLGGTEHSLEVYLSDVFGQAVTAMLEGMPALLGNALLGVPGVFIFILVAVVASIYFALDLESVNAAVLSLFGEKTREKIRALKKGIFKAALQYAGAYAVLLAITFVLLLVGFLVVGVPYALLLSFVFSLVDLLP
ncbi:MAG: AI-2E family transporter, partial [Clostridia bacterium]|nr:AI-2E family transporter [Clostridia bacterium]